MHNLKELEELHKYHYTKSQIARGQILPLAVVVWIAAAAYFIAEAINADTIAGYALLASLATVAIQLIFYGLFLWHYSKSKDVAAVIISYEKSKEEKS